MKRVGIFAGSFDPIHAGHLAFARQALETCKLDKVFFLVEPRPRRKQGVRALEHRQSMVQLAIADDTRLGSIELNQARFSVDATLPVLKELFKGAKLHLILGDDVLGHLADWPHVTQLIQNVTFIIGVRSKTLSEAHRCLRTLERSRGLKPNYALFVSAVPAVTSSQIRLQLKHGLQPTTIAPTVLSYIEANKLYSSVVDSK